MPLTNAELILLKADIDANSGPGGEFENVPDGPVAHDGHDLIAKAYNLPAAPDFFVWRTDLSQSEIDEVVDWMEVVALATNDLLAFQLLKSQPTINTAKSSIRQAFNSIFPSAQNPNTNAALLAAAKRKALRVEQVLSTGTGSEAVPAVMDREGVVTRFDVEAARALP